MGEPDYTDRSAPDADLPEKDVLAGISFRPGAERQVSIVVALSGSPIREIRG